MEQVQTYFRDAKDAQTAPQPVSDERPWGRWRVLEEGQGYKLKMLEVKPGHRLSLQYHHLRSEHWVVVRGRARVVIGARSFELGMLESVVIPAHTAHRVENPGTETLLLAEVQQGEQLLEEDIVRLQDDYNRSAPEQ